MAAMPFTRPRHWLRWLPVAVAGLVVPAAAGPFVYIHFFNSTPAALSLSPGTTTSAQASTGGSESPQPAARSPAPGRSGPAPSSATASTRCCSARAPPRSAAPATVTGHLTIAGSHGDRRRVQRADGHRAQRQEPARRAVRRPDHGRVPVPDRDLHPDQPDRPGPAAGRRGDQGLHRARPADPARHHPGGHVHPLPPSARAARSRSPATSRCCSRTTASRTRASPASSPRRTTACSSSCWCSTGPSR